MNFLLIKIWDSWTLSSPKYMISITIARHGWHRVSSNEKEAGKVLSTDEYFSNLSKSVWVKMQVATRINDKIFFLVYTPLLHIPNGNPKREIH